MSKNADLLCGCKVHGQWEQLRPRIWFLHKHGKFATLFDLGIRSFGFVLGSDNPFAPLDHRVHRLGFASMADAQRAAEVEMARDGGAA